MTPTSLTLMSAANTLKQGGLDAWRQEQVARFQASHSNFQNTYIAFSNRTKRATAPITSEADLLTYNALYASRHIACLRNLLNTLVIQEHTDTPIRVFDYGCGQGLASLVLLEMLQNHPRRLAIELHLIEPSALALHHAQYYVRNHYAMQRHHIEVTTHNTGLNGVMVTSAARKTIHLFSNVLDMAYLGMFNLRQWAQTVQQQTGDHVCLAVSPSYLSGQLGFQQLCQLFPQATIREYAPYMTIEHSAFNFYKGRMVQEAKTAQFLALHFSASAIQRGTAHGSV